MQQPAGAGVNQIYAGRNAIDDQIAAIGGKVHSGVTAIEWLDINPGPRIDVENSTLCYVDDGQAASVSGQSRPQRCA